MPIDSRASLDRNPDKSNWVENSGGLPQYILRIANHLHQEKGMDISRAIATAVNVVKKMCSEGDLNFKGKQNVNPASHAEACAAVADWERKKAQARVSKGIHGRKLTDQEFIEMTGLDEVLKRGFLASEFRGFGGKWAKHGSKKKKEEEELAAWKAKRAARANPYSAKWRREHPSNVPKSNAAATVMMGPRKEKSISKEFIEMPELEEVLKAGFKPNQHRGFGGRWDLLSGRKIVQVKGLDEGQQKQYFHGHDSLHMSHTDSLLSAQMVGTRKGTQVHKLGPIGQSAYHTAHGQGATHTDAITIARTADMAGTRKGTRVASLSLNQQGFYHAAHEQGATHIDAFNFALATSKEKIKTPKSGSIGKMADREFDEILSKADF